MTTPQQNPNVVVRLHPEVYKRLEQQFSKPLVTDNTTAISAAYYLGVEAVLKAVRNGLTMETPDV